MDFGAFEQRKQDHIDLSMDQNNQALGWAGFDQLRLAHDSLPELDFAQIDVKTLSLGKEIPSPFYVPGMTAGHADAFKINEAIAAACAEMGWAMGFGSQRRDLSPKGDAAEIDRWQDLREKAQSVELIGNIGLSQLTEIETSQLQELLERSGARVLAVHLNALQEVFQPEGTPQFSRGIDSIQRVCSELGLPVILKETGCGISKKTFQKISPLAVQAVDVSGLGGTHWGRIEGRRSNPQTRSHHAAQVFKDWGTPTVDSVIYGVSVFEEQAADQGQAPKEVWASGGIRSGLDAAKALALGATRVGFAKPVMENAMLGKDALVSWMKQIEFEFKVAMFCTGSNSPSELRDVEVMWTRAPI